MKNPTLFNNKYECKNKIGSGGFCTVYKVLNVINKEFYALKLFSGELYDLYEKEIDVLKNIKNKNIIELKDNFYDEINKGHCIVMELCDGDLRDILKKYKPKGLPLNMINKIFFQLNDALKSIIIDLNYIHRNLKPENILIKYTDKNRINFDIKLSSFKFSEFITEEIGKYDNCGTQNYMAPEVEKECYNNKCDLWSLGVILYELYTNKYIFDSNNPKEKHINRYEGIIKKETDNEMINKLIRKLIQVDIDKRITWEEYFKNDFFKNNNENKINQNECEFNIQFFGKTNVLKIDDIENINLEKLNNLILKLFNFKKISEYNLILFYRDPNFLNFNIINSKSINKLKNKDIIKVIIFPHDKESKEKEENKINNLITILEIEDAIFYDQKLKSNINLTPFGENNDNEEKDNFLKNSQENLIIKLLSKCFKTRGIKTLIEKYNEKEITPKKDIKNKNVFSTSKKCLQNICSGFYEMKKFEFHFKTNDKLLFDNLEEYFIFTEKLRNNLSKKLKISPKNIIFGSPQSGSIIVPIVFMKENIKNLNFEEMKESNKNLGELLNINKLPLFEYFDLGPDIFDSRYNNKDDSKWGRNEKRGKEIYIPPKGWMGFGVNVEDNYDNGDASWLCFTGIYENEYAVAYYPITEEDDSIFFNNENENFNEFEYLNLIAKSINSKTGFQTGKGTILYQNIKLAEKQASFIDIDENNIFKLVLMCRVKPTQIRKPKDYSEVWVLEPNSEEIRPYRILLKVYNKNELNRNAPKNFYQYYSISKVFSECLSKKNTSILNENIPQGFTRNEYPIHLYKERSTALTEYLLYKKTEPNNTEERLQSWVYCLHKSLTDKSLKTNKMGLVTNNTIVYSGVHIDQSALNEEFQIGRKLYFGKFLSTSLDRNKAIEFTLGYGFLFIITIKNNENNNYCYNIENFAIVNNQGFQDAEREILITAFTLFKITRIERDNKLSKIYMDCLGFENNNFA